MTKRGRPKNAVEKIELKIHPPATVGSYLDALIATGLYGTDRTAVANNLFNDQLKQLLSKGVIERKKTA